MEAVCPAGSVRGVVGQASRGGGDSLGVRRRPGDRHVTGSGKG